MTGIPLNTLNHVRMAEPGRFHFQDYCIDVMRGQSPERTRWEASLAASGHPLPLPHRSSWARLASGQQSWFLLVRDSLGQMQGGVALQVARSRALPALVLLRCERFGPGIAAPAREAVLHAIAELARRHARVLRAHVETFSPNEAEGQALGEVAERLGYAPVLEPRCYQHTLLVDLTPDLDAVFAGLHATARRHIRAINKHPLQIRPITDDRDGPRMTELYRETFARSGGGGHPPDWSAVMQLSAREPAASRLVGLYRTDRDGADALLAFAWGCGHGDHLHYSVSASTRNTDLRVPLTYPLVWDLMCWGKSNGARYFDFGGVTPGTHGSDDSLGGISDFKRYFSRQVVRVGAEWTYEPRRLQARAARAVTSASAWWSRLAVRA